MQKGLDENALNLAVALDYVRQNVYAPDAGSRTGVPKILVVIVDNLERKQVDWLMIEPKQPTVKHILNFSISSICKIIDISYVLCKRLPKTAFCKFFSLWKCCTSVENRLGHSRVWRIDNNGLVR